MMLLIHEAGHVGEEVRHHVFRAGIDEIGIVEGLLPPFGQGAGDHLHLHIRVRLVAGLRRRLHGRERPAGAIDVEHLTGACAESPQ